MVPPVLGDGLEVHHTSNVAGNNTHYCHFASIAKYCINDGVFFFIQFILCFNWLQYKPVAYGRYIYPNWADVFGWIIALAPFGIAVIVAVKNMSTSSSPFAWQVNLTPLHPFAPYVLCSPRALKLLHIVSDYSKAATTLFRMETFTAPVSLGNGV